MCTANMESKTRNNIHIREGSGLQRVHCTVFVHVFYTIAIYWAEDSVRVVGVSVTSVLENG